MRRKLNNTALFILSTIVAGAFMGCQGDRKPQETVLKGEATIYVEESLLPVVEDVASVFESQYEAKLNLVAKPEAEIINALSRGDATVAVLPRSLEETEVKHFYNKKINPRLTHFAYDAVAFISKKRAIDTIIDLKDVVSIIQGKSSRIKGLVFDNLNSGAARELLTFAKANSFPENGIYSFTKNSEVFEYVAANEGMIGVVGINWILQPTEDVAQYLNKVQVLHVKGGNNDIYDPSQNSLAEKKYPLARDLFVVDCQGYRGLGVGFASFIAGERGQRIILKSGLMPVRVPSRKIITRPGITKENKQ